VRRYDKYHCGMARKVAKFPSASKFSIPDFREHSNIFMNQLAIRRIGRAAVWNQCHAMKNILVILVCYDSLKVKVLFRMMKCPDRLYLHVLQFQLTQCSKY
jgi:hypothetical protein